MGKIITLLGFVLALPLMGCTAVLGDFTVAAGDDGGARGMSEDAGTDALPMVSVADSTPAPDAADAAPNAPDATPDAPTDMVADGGAAMPEAASCTPTSRTNGVGESYESCAEPNTYTQATAMAACEAYALAIGDTAANCSGPWNCGTGSSICHGTSDAHGSAGLTCETYCWVYSGNSVGEVSDCSCPLAKRGTWQ